MVFPRPLPRPECERGTQGGGCGYVLSGKELETRVVLSTFMVNTTLDTDAVNLTTGKDASGHISLRSAIQAANSKPNAEQDHHSQRDIHAYDRRRQ